MRLITLEQLLEMKINDESFTLVDTLPSESYKKGHIPGAVNIPSDKVAAMAEEKLEKDATIVTYCGGYTCKASTIAAKKLLDLGYENTVDFKAGLQGWKDAGFEIES